LVHTCDDVFASAAQHVVKLRGPSSFKYLMAASRNLWGGIPDRPARAPAKERATAGIKRSEAIEHTVHVRVLKRGTGLENAQKVSVRALNSRGRLIAASGTLAEGAQFDLT
jgi:hypothetical protein